MKQSELTCDRETIILSKAGLKVTLPILASAFDRISIDGMIFYASPVLRLDGEPEKFTWILIHETA